MTLLNAVSRPLYGAYRLARLDPDGLKYFDITPAGFWFSFFAAVLALPMYAMIMAATWIDVTADVPIWRIIVVELIAYVIAWTAFPVIMPFVVRALDREQHFVRGIVSYNWASVLQNLIYMPVVILNLLGVTNGSPIGIVILFLILFYSWYVAKVALDIRPLAASGVVILDILVSVVVNAWSDKILFGQG